MRFQTFFLLAASGIASAQTVSNNLITSKHTPTATAPAFGSSLYFHNAWKPDNPKIELKGPLRLGDFVVADKLELSLRNYIDAVLANNTDIAIQRLSVEPARNSILRNYSIFDPAFLASFNATRRQQPANDALAGASIQSTLNQPFSIRAQQLLPTGATYFIGFDTTKFSTNSSFALYNPAISSNLNATFSQPLMRYRGSFITKLPVTIAQSRLRQTEYSIEDQILRLVNNAENAYWDVVFARENLKVQEQNLALNEQLLKRAQRELELGSMSELEIYQPKAQYANAEIAVVQARYSLQAAEDVLRRQMGADLDPQLRDLPITLTETIAAPPELALDRNELVQKGLRQRPDVKFARQALDADDLITKGAANALRPDLSLTAQYGTFGRGGPFTQRSNIFGTDGTPSIVANVLPGGIGDALNQVFAFNYPVYGAGLTLRLPLRDRRAAADYADSLVNKRLDLLRLRNQEQTVRLDVLNAITNVENSRASVKLAEVQLDAAQKRLEGDQKRYDLGVITLFFLLDAQTAYNRAQSDLVRQAVNYRRNITTLSRQTGDLLTERNIAVQ